ncbi:hypothetical protein HMPREF9597_00340 [Cutibacterium acnes HL005PA4]|nr:hypothetical protein HMPREF9597_00340 [Cutibacterium acnes HL005PA4]EFS84841.1 hypothetical protein HMPREF9600_00985 [Cutibacterium acnes HL050PA3]EGF04635.1 hypothetical protein HMPREF9586_00079 [Cutibacterium acnes HL083PA2]
MVLRPQSGLVRCRSLKAPTAAGRYASRRHVAVSSASNPAVGEFRPVLTGSTVPGWSAVGC